jgi:Phage integrase, N-terminal SAM-like domain
MTTSGTRRRRGSGSARKRGTGWEFRFRMNGVQQSLYGQTLADARKHADETRWARQQRSGCSPTVREWLAEWLALRRSSWRPQTWRAYDMYARQHIVPAIGDVRLDALTPVTSISCTRACSARSAPRQRFTHTVCCPQRSALLPGMATGCRLRSMMSRRRAGPLP